MQYLGPHACHFKHFFIGNAVHFAGRGADVGVGGVDAVNVGVNIAFHRAQRRSQSHRRGVRAATAKGGDASVFGAALKASHHKNVIFLEVLAQRVAVDRADTRTTKVVVCGNGNLPAEQRAGANARIFQQHGEQADGNLLASGNERIDFCAVGRRRPFVSKGKQLVGVASPRRKHRNDLIPLGKACQHFFTHLLHALQLGNRCAAKFLDQNFHACIHCPQSLMGTTGQPTPELVTRGQDCPQANFGAGGAKAQRQ